METPEFTPFLEIGPVWVPPVLRTPRLLIRALESADIPAIFAYCSNPRVARYTLWDAHTTWEDSRSFVEDYAAFRMRQGVPEPLALIETHTGHVIGTAGAFWVSRQNGTMEIGYALAEAYWGRGYAAEAGRAIVDYVFGHFDCERLQGRVLEGNTASGRVLTKMGFTYEGTLRHSQFHRGQFVDVHIHSLLKCEWLLATSLPG
jgi:[ribosomal protein S5]-alanine N-acetyltransferase